MRLGFGLHLGTIASSAGASAPTAASLKAAATYGHWLGSDLSDGATGAWAATNGTGNNLLLGGTSGDDSVDEPTVSGGVVTTTTPAVVVGDFQPTIASGGTLTVAYLMNLSADAAPSGRLFTTYNEAGGAGVALRWRTSARLDVLATDGTNTVDSGNTATVPASGDFWVGLTITATDLIIYVDGASAVSVSRGSVGAMTSVEPTFGLNCRPNLSTESQIAVKEFVLTAGAWSADDWALVGASA